MSGMSVSERAEQLVVFTNLGCAKFLMMTSYSVPGWSAEHQHGNIFGNNMVTFNGKLFWTVVYFSIVNDFMAKKYADLVKGIILKAIS